MSTKADILEAQPGDTFTVTDGRLVWTYTFEQLRVAVSMRVLGIAGTLDIPFTRSEGCRHARQELLGHIRLGREVKVAHS